MPGFRSITAYLPDRASTLGLGLLAEVFADRSHMGLPAFEVTICADRPGVVRTDLGLNVHVEHGLNRLAGGELVVLLPGNSFRSDVQAVVLDAVRAAHRRGAIVASHCTGSYFLAATGLLDGRQASTHWRFAADFATRFPAVHVRADDLYVDEGRIVTGAGAAAGVDMYLHLLRREHGSAVANAVARDVVVAPHRSGGQGQYITTPVPADPDDERLADVIAWAAGNLDRILSVEELAARALMSGRTFTRRFKAATGATPHAWLRDQRLRRAENLLEITDRPIEHIARDVGYASATVLREQFVKHRGVSPRQYRQTFGSTGRPVRSS
ncbi:GlxA family transcriptional regulator [Virgisporangium aurantiacum]|uniref:AraC family transcriptional regulator n=1 Tax=Virgisporangium aurantiacum TaxID=175570 RepID=A0A8J4E711_9ACTN|nr:helix-turn-helix domain-containing protein [Virgisporangium aurantiacum]GIJ63688.1 AraC family transcriptional regulator [Virgisporangium aurantiacum]